MNLAQCNLQEKDFAVLSTALETNTVLAALDVSGNTISADELQTMLKCLRNNKTLKSLRVTELQISEERRKTALEQDAFSTEDEQSEMADQREGPISNILKVLASSALNEPINLESFEVVALSNKCSNFTAGEKEVLSEALTKWEESRLSRISKDVDPEFLRSMDSDKVENKLAALLAANRIKRNLCFEIEEGECDQY
eukprot:439848_1